MRQIRKVDERIGKVIVARLPDAEPYEMNAVGNLDLASDSKPHQEEG